MKALIVTGIFLPEIGGGASYMPVSTYSNFLTELVWRDIDLHQSPRYVVRD